MKIILNNFDKVNSFLKIAEKESCRIELRHNGYIVNGKSLLGILSLDLSQSIELTLALNNLEAYEKYKKFEVK